MNYAFAPGTSTPEKVMRLMLGKRTGTKVIDNPVITDVSGFLTALKSQPDKADDIVPGSHASDDGLLYLALDVTTSTLPITFEALQGVNTSGNIKIPASVRKPTTNVHFKGCSIGADDSKPFLQLLKKALDNPQKLTAPRFRYGALGVGTKGFLEFMAYAYRVTSVKGFTTTKDLIDAFKAAKFKAELDGTPVDPKNWTKWVSRKLKLKPARRDKVQFRFPVTINPAIGRIKAIPQLTGECRAIAQRFTRGFNVSGTVPTKKPDQIAALKNNLQGDARFKSSHPYPLYARMHFANLNDFMNGLSWKFTINGQNLMAVGTRFEYFAIVPILVPGTKDELLHNFYPVSGTPTLHFEEDNATFKMFGVV